jgi:hypothetical protein
MHFRLYSGLGWNLGLMEGLEGLFSFVNLLEMQGIAKQSGIQVAYGTMKPWTKNAYRLGRTKVHQNPISKRFQMMVVHQILLRHLSLVPKARKRNLSLFQDTNGKKTLVG